MNILFAALAGYVCGSIPFGLLLTRMAGLGDVRQIGSGNIGATNVLRTGNKKLAAATLLLDLVKGFAPVFFASHYVPALAGIVALAAVIGHCFPVWLGFKGGKGVATFFGTLLAAAWPVGLLAGATWILVAFVFRISSLGALTAALLAPVYALLLGRPVIAALAAFMAVLIYIRHAANIRRLLKGEEPRIGGKKG